MPVTSPAAAQPPPQQASPPPAHPAADAALTAAAITALAAAGTSALASTPAAIYAALYPVLRARQVITGAALQAAIALIMQWPPDRLEGTGPAQRHAVRQNLVRRAQFLVHAAVRIQAAITGARSKDEPVMAAIRDAIAAERRFLSQHIAASTQRVRAASAVDGMAAVHGNLLGWQSAEDSNCTPGCAAASGKNFRADRPPIIEGSPAYPGTVHGATCRCRPVAPFKDAALLPS
jgi:hypothetical protein